MTQEQLLNEAVLLAGEAIALAEAYAGGESETCDELTLQLTKLEARAEKATHKTPDLLFAVKCALADLEGIMPEFEPSGDRKHPAWETIKLLKKSIK